MVTGLHLSYKATAKPWANLKTGNLERQHRDGGGGGLGWDAACALCGELKKEEKQ